MICKRIPNLNKQQLKICENSPEILTVINKGIQIALNECQKLFNNNRYILNKNYNCTLWLQNSINRFYINITDVNIIGTKEQSFVHALFTAAVVYKLSEACTRSNFPYCSCRKNYNDNNDNYKMKKTIFETYNTDKNTIQSSSTSTSYNNLLLNQEWKWNGCTNNIQFGVETARIFLDSSEHQMMSPYSLINLHNNNVGRKIIRDGLVFRCQCHGFSGSCTLRTCWHTIRNFRQATQLLYNRYINAKMVSYKWLNRLYKQKYEKILSKKTKTIRTRKKLNQLQKLLYNITMFELNQPNLNRLNDHYNNNDDNNNQIVKITKRDLIYIKPSINYCNNNNNNNENNLINYSKNHSLLINNSTILCVINNNINKTNNNKYNSNDNNELNYYEKQWPPIESCDKICCNLGYRKKTRLKTYQCDCVFQFCCSIICKSTCSTMTTEYECIND